MNDDPNWELTQRSKDLWKCGQCGKKFTKLWPRDIDKAKPCKCIKCGAVAALPIGRLAP